MQSPAHEIKTIAIIDDDAVLRKSLELRLTKEGYAIQSAADGAAALEMLRRIRPDLVLLDLLLPSVPGLEVLKHIRSDAVLKNVPVIVFTNSYLSSMIQAAWQKGATRCLTKASCTLEQLSEIIQGLLAAPSALKVPPAPLPSAALPDPTSGRTTTSQNNLRAEVLANAPALIASLRALFQGASKAGDLATQQPIIAEMGRTIHTLTGSASMGGLTFVAQLCGVLEALLQELSSKSENVHASSLRTVALAIDLLNDLLEPDQSKPNDFAVPPLTLVVDDDPISSRAVCAALEKARLRTVRTDQPSLALTLMEQNPFNLVLLDVRMPGMDGFAVCKQLRAFEHHHRTPVIFVTSLADFATRANSMLSGGNDLFAKPFLLADLACRALTCLIRAELQAASPPDAAIPPARP